MCELLSIINCQRTDSEERDGVMEVLTCKSIGSAANFKEESKHHIWGRGVSKVYMQAGFPQLFRVGGCPGGCQNLYLKS